MKRTLVGILAVFLLGCGYASPALADSERKIIGVATFVDHVVLNTIRDSMIQELQALGYTKENGWQIIVKSANGQPDQTSSVADELLNLGSACIVSISTPSTKPVFEKNMGRTPHVYSFVSFPSSIGVKDDSKNTTGLSDGVDFEGSFDLIKLLVPGLHRLGMVYSDEPNAVISKDEMLRIAKERKIEFLGQAVSKEDEIVPALQGLLTKGVDAVFVGADSAVVNKIVSVVDLAAAAKIPVFATDEGSIKMGAVAGLSVNYKDFGRQTAKTVDSVIRAKTADGIRPLKYKGTDLSINRTKAEQIGLPLPEEVLKRAATIL